MLLKNQSFQKRFFSSIIIIIFVTVIFFITVMGKTIGSYIALIILACFFIIGLSEIIFAIDSLYFRRRQRKRFYFLEILQSSFILLPLLLNVEEIQMISRMENDPSQLVSIIQIFFNYRYWILLCSIPFFFAFLKIILLVIYKKNEIKNKTVSIIFYSFAFMLINILMTSAWILLNIHYQIFLFLFFIAPICDTFAYLGGYCFGKRILKGKKLAPSISPKKTWIGFLIGTCFGLIYFYTIGFQVHFFDFFKEYNELYYSVLIIAPITFCIVSVIGDLFFSSVKREYAIKDFSQLIPGHGGLMDRLDSISFVFLLFFCWVYLL